MIEEEMSGLSSLRSPLQSRLRYSLAYISITFLVVAAFFVSFSLTGNAIGNITVKNCAWISTCLFFVGLVLAFIYARGKKK